MDIELLIIGIDAADPEIIFSSLDKLPNLNKIISSGISGRTVPLSGLSAMEEDIVRLLADGDFYRTTKTSFFLKK